MKSARDTIPQYYWRNALRGLSGGFDFSELSEVLKTSEQFFVIIRMKGKNFSEGPKLLRTFKNF